MLSELGSFAGEGWEQDDDITLAVIHRKSVKATAAEAQDEAVVAAAL